MSAAMLDLDDLKRTLALLEAVAEDRSLLAELLTDLRTALLRRAAEVAVPERSARRKLRKAPFRRRDETQIRRRTTRSWSRRPKMRSARRASIFLPPPRAEASAPIGLLEEPRACYVCKERFRELHLFYDSLCPACAELNYGKRFQTADLTGQVALVTGARIKIGYQIAIMLLRAGARVVVTTRFPHDAARRYAREPDFAEFSDRLEIHGIDLRHAPSVEILAGELAARLPRLDILINNAAQTVRRPPAFYTHLIDDEERALTDLPAELRPLLGACHALRDELARSPIRAGEGLVEWHGPSPAIGLTSPARLSQLPCAADGDHVTETVFPGGALDADLQQIDLRPINTWRLPLAGVPTPELLEVHLVNAIAPFILTSRLRPLLERDRTNAKHVINVSAMEAQFSRHKKTDKHPAHQHGQGRACNMMTRTSAVDYEAAGIHMNSVDTGWITDEDPFVHVERKQRVHGFHPPLDIVDGAARVLDPLFLGITTGNHPWGLFFKDYRPVDW